MASIDELIESINNISLKDEIDVAIESTVDEYTELQKKQLSEGKRSDGDEIYNVNTGKDTYSPSYAKLKGKSKPIDLKRKGDFYRGIIIDVRNDGVVTEGADSKTPLLVERYGQEVLGLNDVNQSTYNINILQPKATQLIIKQITG